MACFRPLTGHRDGSGRVSIKKAGSAGGLKIACGQCRGCRLEQSRQWATRCVHEASQHEKNCFVTLTYDNQHLPPGGSLDLADWQKFAKRTRKKMGAFRFFHCGEYGDMHERAHLHACLFGLDFSHDREQITESRNGDAYYESATLSELWPNGRHMIGELTFESAAYCARYVMKKLTGGRALEYGERKSPYITMSRRPGIGRTWIERYKKDVYRDDFVIVNGKKTRPPRYYDSVLTESQLAELKSRRAEKALQHEEEQTDARLRVKERILEKKLKELIRR